MDFDGNSEAVSQVIKSSHEMCETTERTHGIPATFRDGIYQCGTGMEVMKT